MNVRPLHDNVFIKRLEPETKTASGIIIPDVAQQRQCRGTVVAAGPGKTGDDGVLRPLTVKAGDEVLVGRYDGREVEVDTEKYLIVRESEILGVCES